MLGRGAFHTWHDLALSLREDTLTWFDLDSAQLADVRSMAGGAGQMRWYAESVLALLADTSITRWPELLPEMPSGRRGQEPEAPRPEKQYEQVVHVYPNPSANEFNVQYDLSTEAHELRLEVFDATGRRVYHRLLNGTRTGQVAIGLAPCGGLYVLRLSADGRAIDQRKLICTDR